MLSKKLRKLKIPKFPYDGKYLLSKGIPEGKQLGKVLKSLEEEWINNNYAIDEVKIDKIIKKFSY